MLSEPIVLMILPACLVLVGMISGFVLWSWARGIDSEAIEDIHDDIRRLSNRFKERENHPGLVELQLENEELRTECDSLIQRHVGTVQELQELKAMIRIYESESLLAEQTIMQLRADLKEERVQATATPVIESPTRESYEFVAPIIYSPDLQVAKDVAPEDVAPEEEPQPLNILRPVFPESTQASLDVEYGGEVRYDAILGLVYSRPPMMNDNLQLISGIASKLEQQLNDFGVYTFQQIMLWNDNNIDEFSNLLDTFQDRIQRDDWVGQAKSLYEKSRSMRKAA